jgi:hypothetical protein
MGIMHLAIVALTLTVLIYVCYHVYQIKAKA